MIVPEGTGVVKKVFPASGAASTFTFPVGNISGTAFYSPATITATSPANFNGLTVNLRLGVNAINSSLCQSLSNYLKRSWIFTSTGTVPTYNISMIFNPATDVVGTLGNIQNARYNGSAWNYTGAIGASTVSFTGLTTTFGIFTGADPFGTRAVATPNPICPGATSTISTSVCGGTTPYTYAWSNGRTTSSFTVSGLSTGSYPYTVTVTSASSSRVSTVTLTVAPITLTPLATNSSCYCCNDGSIGISVTNGATPFTYAWSNGSTLPNATNLSQGTYSVTVTDAGGCSATTSASITQPANPDAGADQVICSGGSAQLAATSGFTFYSWTPTTGLNNANIYNPVATPSTTTQYTVQVGTPSSNNLVTNGNFSQGNTGFVSDYVYTNTPQTGGTGGLYPEGFYAVAPSPRPFHDNFWGVHDHTSGSGNYMIINGAPSADHVWEETVPVQTNTWYAFSTWINTQNSILPAALRFTINGERLGPVIFAPADTATWVQFYTNWYSDANTTALIQIVDTVTIAGGNDFGLDDISFAPYCFTTDQVTVSVSNMQLTLTPAQVNCYNGNDGSVALSVAGAIGTPTYIWSNGAVTQNIAGLTAGTYSVTVADGANPTCKKTGSVMITQPAAPLSAGISAQTNVSCYGQSTGQATVTVTGGTSGYTYSWSTIPAQNLATATGLSVGTYT
jgi:hypothetical protein